jgi:hypothetical protein
MGGAPSAEQQVTAVTLPVTMETMFAAGRRSLPPVPRPVPGRETPVAAAAEHNTAADLPGGLPAAVPVLAPGPQDDGQTFVSRLRAAAPRLAQAGGAQSAVVREVVPPARHRRARCRIVLRSADGTESDLVFLGDAGRPEAGSSAGFGAQIEQWLRDGQQRRSPWLVPDDDAVDGLAIDLSVWHTRA